MKEQNLKSQNTYDHLFYNNLYLVDILVKKFKYSYLDRDDLRQAGLMGLFQACLHYKEEKGVKFNTFATYYIIGEIKKEIRNNRLIKLNDKVNKVKQMLYDGISITKIKEITSFNDDLINEAIISSDKVEIIDVEYGKINNKSNEFYQELKNKLEELSKNRKLKKVVLVLYLSYFEKLKQVKIAERLNLSQSQVSRILSIGKKLLKE